MTRKLRIGINALYLIPGGVGGTEVYLKQLLAAMARKPRGHSFVVFTNREMGSKIEVDSPSVTIVETGVNATSRPSRILYEQTGLVSAALRAKIDVMLNTGFTAPLLLPRPNVTMIHDLQHHHHPEYFKATDLLAWRFLVWASAKNAKRLMTVSEASREDINAVYGVPLDRIRAAEPGFEPEFLTLERKRIEPLILCVSTLHPHKNIERLIDAFADFCLKRKEYKLVLAGMRGFHTEAIEKRIDERGVRDRVTITGWISRADIMGLYSKARIAVFPSTFEGFGMPVVEAMAAGVPLITSDVRPMKDTAGDTALLFPATDTAALTEAMEKLAANETLRNMMASRAKKRVAAFTWDRAATIALDTLEQAAKS